MNHFLYPDQGASAWLASYNLRARAGTLTGNGTFGLAWDVWRDGRHMGRSYLPEAGETLDSWCRRNYPDIAAPDYAASLMGVPMVGGADLLPVPTRQAMDEAMSLTTATDILKAVLATARWPRPPGDVSTVPTANTLRQRLHQAPHDWIPVRIVDQAEGVVIRAVIAKKAEPQPVQKAAYSADLYRRDGSTVKGDLDPVAVHFDAPVADCGDSVARRPIVKAAKRALRLTGTHSVAIESGSYWFTHKLTGYPYNIRVTQRTLHPREERREEGYFDV